VLFGRQAGTFAPACDMRESGLFGCAHICTTRLPPAADYHRLLTESAAAANATAERYCPAVPGGPAAWPRRYGDYFGDPPILLVSRAYASRAYSAPIWRACSGEPAVDRRFRSLGQADLGHIVELSRDRERRVRTICCI